MYWTLFWIGFGFWAGVGTATFWRKYWVLPPEPRSEPREDVEEVLADVDRRLASRIPARRRLAPLWEREIRDILSDEGS